VSAIAFAACKDDDRAASSGSPDDAAPVVVYDAGPQPTSERAAEVLLRFARAMDKRDFTAAAAELVVPGGQKDEETQAYLAAMLANRHVSEAGALAVTQRGFEALGARFKAIDITGKKNLAISEGYAFGDLEASAVLQWSGTRFYVVGVYNLGLIEE
jgi:hypothetical protein